MRHTREILRQRLLLQRSFREISLSLRVSVRAAANAVSRAHAEALDWQAVQALTDADLEALWREYLGDPTLADAICDRILLAPPILKHAASCWCLLHRQGGGWNISSAIWSGS